MHFVHVLHGSSISSSSQVPEISVADVASYLQSHKRIPQAPTTATSSSSGGPVFARSFANSGSDSSADVSSSKPMVLVDTRTDEEASVSMIPGGALRQSDFERRRTEWQDHRVVCYCTVGYRSGVYARQLRSNHDMDACNLKGSIAAWTHERLPLTARYDPRSGSADVIGPGDDIGGTGVEATRKVHVFSENYALQADGYEPVCVANTHEAYTNH